QGDLAHIKLAPECAIRRCINVTSEMGAQLDKQGSFGFACKFLFQFLENALNDRKRPVAVERLVRSGFLRLRCTAMFLYVLAAEKEFRPLASFVVLVDQIIPQASQQERPKAAFPLVHI